MESVQQLDVFPLEANDSQMPGYDVHHGPMHGLPQDPFSMNLSYVPYLGQLKQVPGWEVGVKITSYMVIIIMALIGNFIVLITVARTRRLHTTTNFYIVNLAVSDLLVTLMCTWVHLVDDLTEGWVLGAFFCKFNTFAQVLSLVSSILTLTLIACDRFFGIVFAMRAHLTERRASTFILLIWICSVGASAPLLVYRRQEVRVWANHTEIWCDDAWPVDTHIILSANGDLVPVTTRRARQLYYTFISLVLYFVPIAVMSAAYSVIICKLWSRLPPGEQLSATAHSQVQLKRKVVKMLIVLLSSFAFCWFPFQVNILYAEHRPSKEFALPPWYGQFQYASTLLAYGNSAINPIIYTCFNDSFRKGFKNLFHVRKKRLPILPNASLNQYYYNSMEMKTEVCHCEPANL